MTLNLNGQHGRGGARRCTTTAAGLLFSGSSRKLHNALAVAAVVICTQRLNMFPPEFEDRARHCSSLSRRAHRRRQAEWVNSPASPSLSFAASVVAALPFSHCLSTIAR